MLIPLCTLFLMASPREQSSPTVSKSDNHAASQRLDEIRPQAEPRVYPPVTIERIAALELRYRLIQRFGSPWFCDPDSYPVANSTRERAAAMQGFPAIRKDVQTFRAVAKHLGLAEFAEFSEEQKILVYREYKKLRGAISLEKQENVFRFAVSVPEGPTKSYRANGFRITGLIDLDGRIKKIDKTPIILGCPICLARGTRIETPSGQVAVEELGSGMAVWTLDSRHVRVARPILRLTAVAVPEGHLVLHISLSDGRELRVSPGHPTADGRDVSELKLGNPYDGAKIEYAELERYSESQTFDLLPAGDTGVYWANGILLGSTLR